MATDATEKKKATKSSGAAPPEPEQLPCPRCDSTNTKFCYYNNYNFSQPRHFCKACRRYWTHGGTLRDIPIGGATRKNAKRSRTSAAALFSPAYHRPAPSHLMPPLAAHHGGATPFTGDGKMSGGFTSLLSSAPAGGLLSLGGFAVGLEEVGFGLGRASWPFAAVVEGGAGGVDGGGSSVGAQPWQVESGENGFVGDGDCFAISDLAISTPGSIFLNK